MEGRDYGCKMVAEVEFSDIGKVLDEVGWDDVMDHFTDEIQSKIGDAVSEAEKAKDGEIAQLEARIAELEA